MIMRWKETVKIFRDDFERRTFLSSSGALLISVVFAFYNGYLGLRYESLWYGSICIYYIILGILRAFLVVADFRIERGDPDRREGRRRRVFLLTNGMLLLLNLSLIVPISLMVKLQKPVKMTLVPAIAMAAYTTYKIILASVNMKRTGRIKNLLAKELRTIGFIDALLSVVVLQNTLIVVNSDGKDRSMLLFSAITSAAILLLMLAVSVYGFIKGIGQGEKRTNYG